MLRLFDIRTDKFETSRLVVDLCRNMSNMKPVCATRMEAPTLEP